MHQGAVDRACPVTWAFLRTAGSIYDMGRYQNEVWTDALDEAADIAAHGGSDRMKQHQRAFYCVELMLHRCLPRLGLTRPMASWPRSREGLNQILAFAQEQRDELIAEVTEYYYLLERPRDERQLLHERNQQRAELFQYICEACVILRQSLKNPDVTLTRVGKRAALAVNTSTFFIDDAILFSKDMIYYSEYRAWEPRPT